MIRTHSQVHRTDKYSQRSSILWPVWRNSWVFVYELSVCGLEFCSSHLYSLVYNHFYQKCLVFVCWSNSCTFRLLGKDPENTFFKKVSGNFTRKILIFFYCFYTLVKGKFFINGVMCHTLMTLKYFRVS